MNRSEMFSVLQTNLRARIPDLRGKPILESHGLRELGGLSLEAMEAITLSMDQLHISVPRDQLAQARNLGSVLNLFESAAGR